MEMLIYILVTLAVLAAIAYWFRGYVPGMRSSFARLRGFWQLIQGMRQGLRGRGPNPSGRTSGPSRVIDVEPIIKSGSSKKEQCRVCGDSLSSAQLSALGQNDIRCTGSSRVGKACPYRNYN